MPKPIYNVKHCTICDYNSFVYSKVIIRHEYLWACILLICNQNLNYNKNTSLAQLSLSLLKLLLCSDSIYKNEVIKPIQNKLVLSSKFFPGQTFFIKMDLRLEFDSLYSFILYHEMTRKYLLLINGINIINKISSDHHMFVYQYLE